MSQPYLGQVIAVGFNFAPVGWALCQGQLLSIAENSALFNLIGTTFGGNGTTTFGLPDLRGRAALGMGQGSGLQPYNLGEAGGVEFVALTSSQFAGHTHALEAARDGDDADARFGGRSRHTNGGDANLRDRRDADRPRRPTRSRPVAGSGLAHENRQPSTTVNYIIALEGIFPSQN